MIDCGGCFHLPLLYIKKGKLMELIENEIHIPKALLVGIDTGEYDSKASMDELYELAKSAGADAEEDIIQKRDTPDGATYVGSGIMEQIKIFCDENGTELLIFDGELTPIQLRNIEKITDIRVIDRTMLILDIFAQRAKSKEGKLQVELAQLKYMLPRLTGKGVEMSRLGGGIGTRGPGETKLETDRRHIRRRTELLKEQLRDIEGHRNLLRRRREKDGVITVAIVGYTNAGKSTLMNTLTEAGVLAEDKLFATLDPTSRALKLPNGVSVMLIDTVGLVRRLPHHLVEAFKSTLEEAANADIVLNVCDASSEEATLHLEVTAQLLRDLGCTNKPIIPVLNKCDLIPDADRIPFINNAVRISAKNATGIDKLLDAVEKNLPVRIKKTELLIPFTDGSAAAAIRKSCTILYEEYQDNGLKLIALLDDVMYGRYAKYMI